MKNASGDHRFSKPAGAIPGARESPAGHALGHGGSPKAALSGAMGVKFVPARQQDDACKDGHIKQDDWSGSHGADMPSKPGRFLGASEAAPGNFAGYFFFPNTGESVFFIFQSNR